MTEQPPLLPVRHPNRDFFTCDIFETLPYFKDDMASMEHPVFSLSTKPSKRALRYKHNGCAITIKPGMDGLPTIYDKDILLFCASYLRAAIHDGYEPRQRIQFKAHDMLVSTNRPTNNLGYDRLKGALERLKGVVIQTNIETGGKRIESGFGLIDSWHVVKEHPDDGRMIAIEIKLSDWFYSAVVSNELLTISKDYFRLRGTIDRRIYELARKHCGDQKEWTITLSVLQKKVGSSSALREFRRAIKRLAESDHLPDYSLDIADDDSIAFQNRNHKKRKGKTAETLCAPYFAPWVYEKAKQAAPGIDIYAIEHEWREWISDKPEPDKGYEAAFIGFCRGKSKQLQLF